MKEKKFLAACLSILLAFVVSTAPVAVYAAGEEIVLSSPNAHEKRDREDLLAPLREQGEVRIIVGLRSAQAVAQSVDRVPDRVKERTVSERQLRVLQGLAGHDIRAVKRLRLHDFIALTVDSGGLDAVLADSEVASVALDRPRYQAASDTGDQIGRAHV